MAHGIRGRHGKDGQKEEVRETDQEPIKHTKGHEKRGGAPPARTTNDWWETWGKFFGWRLGARRGKVRGSHGHVSVFARFP